MSDQSDTHIDSQTGDLTNQVSDGDTDDTINANANENTNSHANGHIKRWPRLLPISASNAKSLQVRVNDLQQYIRSRHASLDAIAHTLGTRRVHLPHRTFCIAEGDNEPMEFANIQKTPAAKDPALAFIFTGQGAQWAGMGRDLILCAPRFREDIQEMDRTLQDLAQPPQWSIEGSWPKHCINVQDI